jgi:hypothetical protein
LIRQQGPSTRVALRWRKQGYSRLFLGATGNSTSVFANFWENPRVFFAFNGLKRS